MLVPLMIRSILKRLQGQCCYFLGTIKIFQQLFLPENIFNGQRGTFYNPLTFLYFRLVTSAGWNDVLDPLLVTPPDCDMEYRGLPNGNCGHPFVAIIYFVSFIIINFMIVINMYIAIILENFNQAHQEEEIGIVEEDLEMFYTKWAK